MAKCPSIDVTVNITLAVEYALEKDIRQYWQETKSVEQVAERCLVSPREAHRLIVAMLQEEGGE